MSTQRILLFSYILLGALIGVTLENLLDSLFSSVSALGALSHTVFGLEGVTYATLIGYGLALALVLYCWRSPKVRQPATQVVEEMSRVTWPTLAETRSSTWAVVVATLVCAVLLGAFDYGWGAITQWIYSP